MGHYLRKWDHFRELRTPGQSPLHLLDRVPDYDHLELQQSDRIVGRAISMLIKLSWTREDLDERAAGIVKVFGK